MIVLRDGVMVDDKQQDAGARGGGRVMSIWTTLKLAFRALWRNKVRSMLTMLGIIFGIGTVIAMIASGQGAREAVADVFRSMGTNLLMVTNGSVSTGGAAGGQGSRYSLTWKDLEQLENGEVPTIHWVTPRAADQGAGRVRGRELEHDRARREAAVFSRSRTGRRRRARCSTRRPRKTGPEGRA